jgi:hypothetical protein
MVNTREENAADLAHEEANPLPREPEHPAFYTVALAYADRAYGGPEEGGWYYDTYVPAEERIALVLEDTWDMPRTFPGTDEGLESACRWAELLAGWIKETGINKGKARPSSVLSRGDWLDAIVFDGHPCPLPKEKPRYE